MAGISEVTERSETLEEHPASRSTMTLAANSSSVSNFAVMAMFQVAIASFNCSEFCSFAFLPFLRWSLGKRHSKTVT